MKTKKLLSLSLALLLLLSFAACASDAPASTATTNATKATTANPTTEDNTTEEITTFDEPAIPDPEGLVYDQSVPATLSLDRSLHEPLSLWKDREHTPYWDDSLTTVNEPQLFPYLLQESADEPKGCIIVCPGGAYKNLSSEKEGSAVAEYINTTWDMHAFVLEYRLLPADYRANVNDVLRAIRYVRYYSEELGIDPNKILIMGFSAGGHLACMAAEKFDYGKAGDVIDNVSSRPDGAILCYPVITMSESWGHIGSVTNFLGADNVTNQELRNAYSGEKAIREDMPPVFVIHSKKDKVVPYQNSEELAKAMQAAGLSCTIHLYESGGHGFDLAINYPHDSAQWTARCAEWLTEMKFH